MKDIYISDDEDSKNIKILWDKLVELNHVNPLDVAKLNCLEHFYFSFIKKNKKKPTLKDVEKIF